MDPPRIELGSQEPESHMLPLHHGSLYKIPHMSLIEIINTKSINKIKNMTKQKRRKEKKRKKRKKKKKKKKQKKRKEKKRKHVKYLPFKNKTL